MTNRIVDRALRMRGLLEMPSGWTVLPLKSFLRPRSERNNDELPLLSVYRDHGVVPFGSIEGNHNKPSLDLSTYKAVRAGDLVLNKMKTWQGSLAISDYDGIVSPAYVVCRVAGQWDRRYLHHLLRSPSYIAEYASLSYGIRVGQWDMRFEDFRDVLALRPPIEVQRRIVKLLDSETARIDTLIDRKQRFIELLLEKRTALITHAVIKGLDPTVEMKDSGVDFIGRIPGRWEVAPLYARYEVTLGKMLDAKKITGEYLASYVRNTDVQWDRVNVSDLDQMDFGPEARRKFALHPGDLLVCEGGEVGRTGVWRGELTDCYYQKAIHRLRPWCPERDIPRYFFYVMYASAKAERFTVGSNVATIGHLTATQLRHHRFAFPSTAEQQAIVTFLDEHTTKVDSIVEKTRSSIDLLREYRTALISAAVTGQIDIPGSDTTEEVA